MVIRGHLRAIVASLALLPMLACFGIGGEKVNSPSSATIGGAGTTDVYVAGHGLNANSVPAAKIWKNGVAIWESDGTKSFYIRTIAVDGNDIYAAGEDASGSTLIGTLWKNGTIIWQSDGTRSTFIYSISISGSDVYMAGQEMGITGFIGKV